MVRKGRQSEVKDDKRKVEDTQALSSGRIDPEMERRLVEEAGFTRRQLYNRRGAMWEKGLTALLEAGDTLVDVTGAGAVIRTREGTLQVFYNLERPQPFLERASPGPGHAPEQTDGQDESAAERSKR